MSAEEKMDRLSDLRDRLVPRGFYNTTSLFADTASGTVIRASALSPRRYTGFQRLTATVALWGWNIRTAARHAPTF